MLAGPSEILIVADDSANPTYLAADLLSQAEHDPLACAILITDSERVANAVGEEIEVQLAQLPRKEIAGTSLQQAGKIILAKDMPTVIEMANLSAPEHLEIMTKAPFELCRISVMQVRCSWVLILRNRWAITMQDLTTFCRQAVRRSSIPY